MRSFQRGPLLSYNESVHNDTHIHGFTRCCHRQDIARNGFTIDGDRADTLFHMGRVIHRNMISRTPEHTGEFKAIQLVRD